MRGGLECAPIRGEDPAPIDNLTRVMNIVGIKPLMAVIRKRTIILAVSTVLKEVNDNLVSRPTILEDPGAFSCVAASHARRSWRNGRSAEVTGAISGDGELLGVRRL